MDLQNSSNCGAIKAIDRTSVHRICSGQVILNLATAVKELIENSIDAGATNIEVKLKEHGSEVIEVVDNGSGVEECNFQGLTLKHHTSKLKDFSDLVGVDTFGFRGEALSSLCAVSGVSVVTCHIKAKNATKLEFDHSGKITSQGPCARQKGTTVTVQNLFSTLPVRYKEFQRNLKKEFAKMVQVLTAYCLISTGVRITCTNQVGKGKKTTIASVNGNKLVKENITNIFGPKQHSTIIEFRQLKPKEEVCSELGITVSADQQQNCPFQIVGFVSSCENGKGRSTTDRQFIFVNSRPCDLTKVSRTINEVYHMYNRHQYPFVILNICLSKESVDVNVTPDKRQVFVENEKLLLAIIKSSLISMFEPLSSTYDMNQGQGSLGLQCDTLSKFRRMSDSAVPSSKHSPSKQRGSVSSSLANLKRSFSSAFARERDELKSNIDKEKSKQPKLDTFFNTVQNSEAYVDTPESTSTCSSQSTTTDDSGCVFIEHTCSPKQGYQSKNSDKGGECDSEEELSGQRRKHRSSVPKSHDSESENMTLFLSPDVSNSSGVSFGEVDMGRGSRTSDLLEINGADGRERAGFPSELSGKRELAESNKTLSDKKVESQPYGSVDEEHDSHTDSSRTLDVNDVGFKEANMMCSEEGKPTSPLVSPKVFSAAVSSPELSSVTLEEDVDVPVHGDEKSFEESEDCQITFTEYDKNETVCRKSVTVPFSMDSLKRKMVMKKLQGSTGDKPGLMYRNFRAPIAPSSNTQAEEELQKEISKDMFSKMEILGQFNLGFILTKLDQDLFIIDQHATDEKFNFETLQRTTVLEGQKMIQPLKLELTAVNESVIMDNLEIFKKNGFDFIIKDDAPPTEKISLVATPVSKNWMFGKADIEEMVFMLSDSPGAMCRPSRVRQMFASRACRKSIMIGTALNKSEMKKLVCHMGEINQPWNCPHGRPTMRHLINLNMLPDQNS